ncbi:uncharacterized protein METZ01_LOCUS484323 [marine metagenome]|uniref:Uncharacterized protein n=1 Tax=marine metagenome TaxID=408172 RepID=A0A383CHD2_9ZZZZ
MVKASLCSETASGLPDREGELMIPPSMTRRQKSHYQKYRACGLMNSELFCDLVFDLIRNG